MMKQLNHFAEARINVLPLLALISALLMSTGVAAGQSAHKDADPFKHIEISGISLAMPLDQMTEILTAQSYNAVSSRLFTKQGELQNNRRTIFRIEIDDTADSRQITYHRSLSGGRVKTAGGDEPVPEYEVDMAQQFYRLMCDNIPGDVKEERQCEPPTTFSINAGNGRFVQINDQFSLQLNVTAANSAVGIRYTDQ